MDMEHQEAEWDIDKTHPQYHDDLIIGLSGLVDKEIGLSFIELGLIRNITLKENEAHVSMVLTTPFCPYGPEMINDTKDMVERILEVPTTVELSAEYWTPAMMDPEVRDEDWGLFP
jgi:metal-sulfur cluster biosynthetic enzyme